VGARDHRGDAGADRPLADFQRTVADDQRGVADAHAADVGARVGASHREVPDGKPQLAKPRPHSGWGTATSSLGVAAVVGAGVLSALPLPLPLPLEVPLPFAFASCFASLFASRRFSRRRFRPPSRISPIRVWYSMPAACAIRHRSE